MVCGRGLAPLTLPRIHVVGTGQPARSSPIRSGLDLEGHVPNLHAITGTKKSRTAGDRSMPQAKSGLKLMIDGALSVGRFVERLKRSNCGSRSQMERGCSTEGSRSI
ncbi:hypothetical protein CGCF413_v000222 [Colletotrichum fructicola]|nr:hypothetical protein CGCF413_v000222 [Colletotrichum fructicola]